MRRIISSGETAFRCFPPLNLSLPCIIKKNFINHKGDPMAVCSDYHIHTSFSADSEALMDDQIQAAIAAGLSSICFTEHVDLDSPFRNAPPSDPTADFHLDYDAYRQMYLLKKIHYAGRIQIFFGLELGLRASMTDPLHQYLDLHPDFDFVIGSTHSARDGMDPYYDSFFRAWPGEEAFDPYRMYFEAALANIRAFDDFDSYGHLDYILRCGPLSADGSSPERSSSFLYEKYADVIDPILCELILREKALELNTSPLKKGFPETNPGKAILKKYHDFGGRLVTVGSDAHTPEGVGFAFDRAAMLLKECGFTEYVTFEKRQPVMHAL